MVAADGLLILVGAYLIGGIPFGWIVARVKGIDIRKHGSGNVGATNVGRVLGKPYGIGVFALDLAKGASTALAAPPLASAWGTSTDAIAPDWIWLGAGLGCIVGNLFPVYLGFRGGKGVATGAGVILGIYPYLTGPGLMALAIWAVVVKLSRYVSLASMIAAASLPISFLGLSRAASWPLADHYPLLALTIAIAGLVLIRHAANIGRLLSGTESRVGGPRA
jgi:glycerol-3-phosphate acyltransferase PlsY